MNCTKIAEGWALEVVRSSGQRLLTNLGLFKVLEGLKKMPQTAKNIYLSRFLDGNGIEVRNDGEFLYFSKQGHEFSIRLYPATIFMIETAMGKYLRGRVVYDLHDAYTDDIVWGKIEEAKGATTLSTGSLSPGSFFQKEFGTQDDDFKVTLCEIPKGAFVREMPSNGAIAQAFLSAHKDNGAKLDTKRKVIYMVKHAGAAEQVPPPMDEACRTFFGSARITGDVSRGQRRDAPEKKTPTEPRPPIGVESKPVRPSLGGSKRLFPQKGRYFREVEELWREKKFEQIVVMIENPPSALRDAAGACEASVKVTKELELFVTNWERNENDQCRAEAFFSKMKKLSRSDPIYIAVWNTLLDVFSFDGLRKTVTCNQEEADGYSAGEDEESY